MQEHSIKGTGIGIDLSVSRSSIILFFFIIFLLKEKSKVVHLYVMYKVV